MVKIYKYNNKLAIYLPFDVIKALKLEENDEVDFFKMKDNMFILAKKADITSLLVGNAPSTPSYSPVASDEMSGPEIAVLKKLDTLRYQQRTQENVEKMLSPEEKSYLSQLLKKKAVTLFSNQKSGQKIYSISKGVYDTFLMRKRPQGAVAVQQPVPVPRQVPQTRYPIQKMGLEDEGVKKLEAEGFIVLQTEAEAAHVSSLLEDSIRHGQVFGTRAFNKKFYILMRAFLEKNSGAILKELRSGTKKVSEIVESTKIPEGGVRGVLYYLAESGDVIEKRRDTFMLT